jgi:four helix bundle protein
MKTKFRTYEQAILFARECRKLSAPSDLQDQLNRASASIALNLKEGSARHTEKDRHRFYRTALGSFRECEAVFDILDLQSKPLLDLANTLGGCLYRLCQKTNPASMPDATCLD